MFLARQKVKLTLPVNSAVSSVYGIGRMRLFLLRQRFGCELRGKLSSIKVSKQRHITNFVDQYSVANRCKRAVTRILRNFFKYGSYKGIRMQQGLPANGQRTHSNASTSRRLNRILNTVNTKNVKAIKK